MTEEFCFSLIEPRPSAKYRLPRKSFYLIFTFYGEVKVGSLTDRDEAIKKAKEYALADPRHEYVVMRAEVMISRKTDDIEEIIL